MARKAGKKYGKKASEKVERAMHEMFRASTARTSSMVSVNRSTMILALSGSV
jgi:hypothetical protein